MKKLFFLFVVIICTSCTCLLSQIPPQTIYAGAGCTALLPDYTTKVVASDNCVGTITITQTPVAGTILSAANPSLTVVLTAKDAFGNTSKPMNVSVVLIDTVKPILSWPVGQINMTDQDMINIYANWEAAVKVKGIAQWIYDQRWTQGLAFADSTLILDRLKYFENIIKLTDEEYAQYVAIVNANK